MLRPLSFVTLAKWPIDVKPGGKLSDRKADWELNESKPTGYNQELVFCIPNDIKRQAMRLSRILRPSSDRLRRRSASAFSPPQVSLFGQRPGAAGIHRCLAGLALWLIGTLATCGTGVSQEAQDEPFFRLRDQRSEYFGPGREVAPPDDLTEVLIGYFGPDDPEDPETGGMWRAATAVVERANRDGGYRGKPFRLVAAWADNPWTAGVSLLAQQVYRDPVWAIIGGIDGETTHLAEQVVAKARLPLISPVATDKTSNLANVPWMFSVAPGDHLIAPPLATAIAQTAEQRGLIVLSADDHDSRRLAHELLAALRDQQLAPRYRYVVRRGEQDHGELAARVTAAEPSCVLVIADAKDSAALVRALRGAGCTSRIFGGPAMGRRSFIDGAGCDAQGVIFPQLYAMPADRAADFDYAAAHTHDAVQMVVDAIRQAGLNRASIGDALRAMSPMQGITGEIRWDGLGSNMRPVSLGVWRDGKPIALAGDLDPPAPRSEASDARRRVRAATHTVAVARDAQALQPVVVGSEASELVRQAAADLAEMLGRISGAEFEVVAGNGRQGLAVGTPADFPDLELDLEVSADPLERQRYRLLSHPDGVWLIGASDRAAEYAVWDLLHRLGYRLFFPTDTWEIVPQLCDLRVAVDVWEQPDFVTRQAPRGAPWSDQALWKRWRTRNRMTPAFSLNTGHAYGGILRANAQAFRDNPDFYALVDGHRRLAGRVDGGGDIKFCISQPGLRALVVQHAIRVMTDNPQQDSISMDPSDGGHWCQCDACDRMGSISDRAVTLANDVAKAVNGLGLGPKYVGIYAYNQHSPPPSIPVHPHVVVSVATSFIRGGYTVEQLIEGWASQGAVLGVREYHDVFPWSHDMPRRARGGDVAYLSRTIPYFFENGARYMNSENSDSWGANGLGYWLSPILLWDVSAAERIEHYIEDFLELAFESAKPPMHDFYHRLNQDRSVRTSEDVVGRMYRSLAAARELASSPQVHARLDDLVLYTRYVECYQNYRTAKGEARQAAFETLWRLVYRMRDRMMVSTVAICDRDRFRDRSIRIPDEAAWSVPEAENPWKSSQPFGRSELEQIVRAGVDANPILQMEFQPVEFSDRLAPASRLDFAEVPDGSLSLRARGTRRYLIWLQQPGAIRLGVTGGLIAHYRDRGNVKLRLYSSAEATLEPVAQDESVPPDGRQHWVSLRSPYDGLHTLEVSDGSDMTELVFPEDMPLTVRSSIDDPPGNTLTGRWTLYFYVPSGTRIVGGFTDQTTGRMRAADDSVVLDFAELERPGYFHVPVPDGQDGRLWKIEQATGQRLLMTVPPYLARNGSELLLPLEVIEADSD